MGNLDGNLYGMGEYKDNIGKEWKSNKGYYKLSFVESFNKMTDRDIDMRQEYAKDLISHYHSVPKEMITFRKKSSETTLASLDEVFYVKVGQSTAGKVSVRVQRMFRESGLTIVYQEKAIRDIDSPKFRGMRGYKKRSKADIRRANRRNRKGKKRL